MSAVLVRARAGMRGRGRTTLLLVLLLGVAGGVTLAAVAGSSRGRSALGRFVEASRPATVEAFVNPELAPLDQQEDNVVNAFLVRLRGDGEERAAALASLSTDFPDTLLGPMSATGVRDLARVRDLPYLLAGLLGALAVGSVAAMLATVARRRRREVAVLRAVGARRAQVRVLVAAQATTFSLLAVSIGLPLGVAAGRLLWRLVAQGLGSEVGPAVPAASIVLALLVLLLAVNVAAQVPATAIARARPGPDLGAG